LNIFFFCGNFVASIHKSLYVSFLKGKYTEQSLAVNQIGFLFLTVCLIYILPNTTNENKLILISVINGLFCLFVNIFYTIKFFKIEKISLITPLRGVKNIKTEILKMGSKFMIIQVSWVFLFNLDNYLVSNNFSPSIVVPFDCINKLFQFPLMILMAAMSPLWSMFAKDYLDKNHKALFKKFKNFNLLFIAILILLIVFALLCPFIISIWIKQKLEIPNYLIFYITILTAMRIFVNYYMFFLSGIGKVKNYIRILIISVILKLPLTYFFIHLGLGINSVVLSTLLLILIWTVFLPLESYKTVYSLKKQ
jgi:O-antigen/teichoic acid export membrane protein